MLSWAWEHLQGECRPSYVQAALIHQTVLPLQTRMGQRVSAVTGLEPGSGWSRLYPGRRRTGREAEGGTTCELRSQAPHSYSLILSDSLINHTFKGKLLRSSRGRPQGINPQSWSPSEGRVLCDCRVESPWSQPLTIHICFLHIPACVLYCVCVHVNGGKKRTDHASISYCKSLSHVWGLSRREMTRSEVIMPLTF